MTGALRKALLDVLATRIHRGEFVLASGAIAPYYLDAREVTMTPWGARYAGRLFYEQAQRFRASAIAGPATAAVPLVVATMLAHPTAVQGAYIRLARRERGTGRCVEGNLARGSRVLMIDDVATSGGSLVNAARALLAERPDVTIAGFCALVDRGPRHRQPFKLVLPTGHSEYHELNAIFHVDEILERSDDDG